MTKIEKKQIKVLLNTLLEANKDDRMVCLDVGVNPEYSYENSTMKKISTKFKLEVVIREKAKK